MSYLKYITIDMLCIAAEITAALLLISFAIPDKRKPVSAEPKEDLDVDRWKDLARRFCIESAIFRGLAKLNDVPGPIKTEAATGPENREFLESLGSVGFQDKLTHTGNNAFAKEFLSGWLKLPIEQRTGSYLSMLVVDQYSDLLHTKGAMELEMIIRRLSELILNDFESKSIVCRYLPDRFLILHFCGDIALAYHDLVGLREKLNSTSSEGEASQTSLDCTSSIVDLGGSWLTLEQSIDDLDEGISQATDSIEKCAVRNPENLWQSSPPQSSAGNHKTDKAAKETRNPDAGELTTSQASKEANSHDDVSFQKPKEGNGQNTANLDSANTSNDVSANKSTKKADVQAVANNEDIEALFAQINRNKEQATEAAQSQTTTSPENEPAPVSELDDAESVTADDISALFSTVKNATQPAKQELPKSSVNDSADTASENEAVSSADDIAALFASVKNAAPPSVKDTAESPATNSAAVDVDSAASADDIAALFASVKQPSQPTVPGAAESPAANTNAAMDVDSAASPDDIAALFASVKNAAPSTATDVAEPPVAATAGGDMDVEAVASADDIAALFASVKNESKDASLPSPSSESTSQVETSAELASADDIEALFASLPKPSNTKEPSKTEPQPETVQSSTPAQNSKITENSEDKESKAPVKQADSNVQSIVQNLNESASADDIEALFANLK